MLKTAFAAFQAAKVLKGTFKAGRFSAIPGKTLVVVQFTVSIILIVGTVVVYRQIQFAKNRPVGYNREGLLNVHLSTPDIHSHFEAVRNELKDAGAIAEMAKSSSPATTGLHCIPHRRSELILLLAVVAGKIPVSNRNLLVDLHAYRRRSEVAGL